MHQARYLGDQCKAFHAAQRLQGEKLLRQELHVLQEDVQTVRLIVGLPPPAPAKAHITRLAIDQLVTAGKWEAAARALRPWTCEGDGFWSETAPMFSSAMLGLDTESGGFKFCLLTMKHAMFSNAVLQLFERDTDGGEGAPAELARAVLLEEEKLAACNDALIMAERDRLGPQPFALFDTFANACRATVQVSDPFPGVFGSSWDNFVKLMAAENRSSLDHQHQSYLKLLETRDQWKSRVDRYWKDGVKDEKAVPDFLHVQSLLNRNGELSAEVLKDITEKMSKWRPRLRPGACERFASQLGEKLMRLAGNNLAGFAKNLEADLLRAWLCAAELALLDLPQGACRNWLPGCLEKLEAAQRSWLEAEHAAELAKLTDDVGGAPDRIRDVGSKLKACDAEWSTATLDKVIHLRGLIVTWCQEKALQWQDCANGWAELKASAAAAIEAINTHKRVRDHDTEVSDGPGNPGLVATACFRQWSPTSQAGVHVLAKTRTRCHQSRIFWSTGSRHTWCEEKRDKDAISPAFFGAQAPGTQLGPLSQTDLVAETRAPCATFTARTRPRAGHMTA